ncbi:unnamed protein product, partial [Amoebophrya sp. A25]
ESGCTPATPYVRCSQCRRGFTYSERTKRCEPRTCSCQNGKGLTDDPTPVKWSTQLNMTRFPNDTAAAGLLPPDVLNDIVEDVVFREDS